MLFLINYMKLNIEVWVKQQGFQRTRYILTQKQRRKEQNIIDNSGSKESLLQHKFIGTANFHCCK